MAFLHVKAKSLNWLANAHQGERGDGGRIVIGCPICPRLRRLFCLGTALCNQRQTQHRLFKHLDRLSSLICPLFNPQLWPWLIAVRPFTSIHINSQEAVLALPGASHLSSLGPGVYTWLLMVIRLHSDLIVSSSPPSLLSLSLSPLLFFPSLRLCLYLLHSFSPL